MSLMIVQQKPTLVNSIVKGKQTTIEKLNTEGLNKTIPHILLGIYCIYKYSRDSKTKLKFVKIALVHNTVSQTLN